MIRSMQDFSKLKRRAARHLPRHAEPTERDPRDGLDAEMLMLLRRLDDIPYARS